MQLLGQNLSEVRRSRPEGFFSCSTTALLGLQMLQAIENVHRQGYLHRDIKPVRAWRPPRRLGEPVSCEGWRMRVYADYPPPIVGPPPQFPPLPRAQSNFVLGLDLEAGRPAVYLIDFGLARRYSTPAGNHRDVRRDSCPARAPDSVL